MSKTDSTGEPVLAESENLSAWPRRSVLKAGALAVGAAMLGRFALAGDRTIGLTPEEYAGLDAWAMAEAVRAGELTGAELLAAALARCEAVNPQVNAVNMLHEDYARALLNERRAARETGALAGVPLLVKDLSTYLAGTVTSHGSRLFRDSPPSQFTSTLIARYQSAGAVPFGKTATPEFGLTTTTESALWGQTRNPWDIERSAGGSSGGAAAAVAAGIVPAAHATDGGGSIRIPASYCGLVGLKPSRYRTPSGPGRFEGWFGASVAHVVSRTVRDTALFLDAGQGHEAGSPYWTQPLERPFVEAMERAPRRLKIALVSRSLTGATLDPAVAQVLDDTVKLLLGQGHEIEELTLPVDPRELFAAHGKVSATALLSTIRDREEMLGRKLEADELEQITHVVLGNGERVGGLELYRARHSFETISASMERQFERFDLILSPVTANLPPKLGELRLSQPWESYAQKAMGSASFTVLANVSGQPAISLPLGWSEEELPVGMMFTARLGGEELLLRLAGQLEQARPWSARHPGLRV